MSKIRILHVFGSLNHGGAETFIMNIYRKIDREKFQFDFVVHTDSTTFYEEEIKKLGGSIFRVRRYNLINHLFYINDWKKILKGRKYQVVHTHIMSVASIILKLAKRKNIKTIAHSHSTSIKTKNPFEYKLRQILYKRVIFFSDIKLSCGEEAGKFFFGKEKFQILPICVDENIFKNRKEHPVIEINGITKENKKNLGHVGRFIDAKNHSFLIDVFQKLHNESKEYHLFLIGEGPLKIRMQEKVNILNLDSHVHFIGASSKIDEFMRFFDIMVFPSISEGFPVTLVESQFSNLQAVVSTNVPKEIKLNETIKFLSLDVGPSKWAEEIVSLLKSSRSELYETKELKQHTASNVTEQYINIISNLLN